MSSQWDEPVDKEALRGKAAAFRKLHQGPPILMLPNAWDVGSAMVLAAEGFPAIATTSAGIAFAQGYPDGERIGRDEMLAVVSRIVQKVAVPVTADLERGYGATPRDVAETVRRAIAIGVVGANFEDGTGQAAAPLRGLNENVNRIRAAREAADAADIPFVVNARTDGFLASGGMGPEVFDDVVRRANAYRAAGADCLFIPGKLDLDTIERLVRAVDGPINILGGFSGYSAPPLAQLQELGVARVTIGGSLSLSALALVKRVGRELRDQGTFTYAADAFSNAHLNKLLSE